ncbi:hypothetical protein G3M48_005617 [Beauveria asiatica]|uniref:Uncharacterized protein n=1 Tax=Beauveria asiatica TaxID=1069075 RepID=A0AAW0RS52_9HYPO
MPGYGEWEFRKEEQRTPPYYMHSEFREEEQRTPHHVHSVRRYREWEFRKEKQRTPHHVRSTHRYGYVSSLSVDRAPRSSTARLQDYQKERARSGQGAPVRSRSQEYVRRDEYAKFENERDLLFRALQRQVATNPPAQPLPNIPGLITPEQRYALVAYTLMCQERDRIAVDEQLRHEAEVARQAEALERSERRERSERSERRERRERRERSERSGKSYYLYNYGYGDVENL